MKTLRLPPGPRARFLLGNASAFAHDPLAFLAGLARDYGPVAQFRLGLERFYLLSRPAEIEDVLVRRPEGFRKPRSVRVAGRLVLGQALTASDGERWLRQRRLVAPAFHQRPRLEAHGAAMVGAAERATAGWRDGEVRAVDEDAMALMVAALCETLLGLEGEREAAEIGAATASALRGFGARAKLGLPVPDWLPTAANRRMRGGMRVVHRFVEAAIADRRRTGAARGDLLSLLVEARDEEGRRLEDRQLRDEIAVMIGVGGHQAGLALAWALHLLSQGPEAERRLHAELGAVLGGRPPSTADLARLPYTAAVVDEALRLYPPFFLIGREALADGEIAGYRLDRGTTLVLSPWVTQRSALDFEDPEVFRPERWLDGLAERLPRFAYFPFGGGPRVCVANGFARIQLVLALAALARRFQFESVPGHPVVPRPAVALGMRHGLRMIVHARRASPSATASLSLSASSG